MASIPTCQAILPTCSDSSLEKAALSLLNSPCVFVHINHICMDQILNLCFCFTHLCIYLIGNSFVFLLNIIIHLLKSTRRVSAEILIGMLSRQFISGQLTSTSIFLLTCTFINFLQQHSVVFSLQLLQLILVFFTRWPTLMPGNHVHTIWHCLGVSVAVKWHHDHGISHKENISSWLAYRSGG